MTKPERMRGTKLDRRIHALKRDLTHNEGPNISVIRNYPYAILPYLPRKEWELRQKISELAAELRSDGWVVDTLSLQKLMLQRIRRQAGDKLEYLIGLEKRYWSKESPLRPLRNLESRLHRWLKGPEGLASDIVERFETLVEKEPVDERRTVVFLGQVGALYPFVRTSELLQFLDGQTHGIPTVLLYPGSMQDGGLSFMGIKEPNYDYRPRIYDV